MQADGAVGMCQPEKHFENVSGYSELNGGRIEISPVLHPSHDLLDNPTNHVSSLQLPNPVRN